MKETILIYNRWSYNEPGNSLDGEKNLNEASSVNFASPGAEVASRERVRQHSGVWSVRAFRCKYTRAAARDNRSRGNEHTHFYYVRCSGRGHRRGPGHPRP